MEKPDVELRLVAAPKKRTVWSSDETADRVITRPLGGRVAVVGGPGTGKSVTALRRIHHAITEKGLPAQECLLLTANRKAASQARDELSVHTGLAFREPVARTIHAVAHLIVSGGMQLDDETLHLVSGPEQDAALKEILAGHQELAAMGTPVGPRWPEFCQEALPLDGFRHELRDLLMVALEAGLRPDDLREWAHRSGRQEWACAASILEEYESVTKLEHAGAYDPASLLAGACNALDYSPELAASFAHRWKVIVVDDAQELSDAGLKVLDALCSESTDVTLIGDPDASTLAFRGAESARFLQEGNPERTILTTSWRRGPALVAMSANLAQNIGVRNTFEHRQPQHCSRETTQVDDSKTVVYLPTAAHEHAWLARYLRELHMQRRISWSDMAIIARTSGHIQEISRQLTNYDVPVRAPLVQVPLHQEPVVIALRSAITVSLESDPRVEDVETLLASGLFSVGPRDSAGWAPGIADYLSDFDDSVSADEALPEVPRGVIDSLLRLRKVVQEADADGSGTPDSVLWAVWEQWGVAAEWQKLAIRGGRAGVRADHDLDVAMSLFDAAARFLLRNPGSDIRSFVDHVDLLPFASDTLAEDAVAAERVTLTTPAGAAGREWPVVVVAGVQEGVWPNTRLRGSLLGAQDLSDLLVGRTELGQRPDYRSKRKQVVDDELRMFHVATSRARDQLVVTAVDSDEDSPSVFCSLVSNEPVVLSAGDIEPYRVSNLTNVTAQLRVKAVEGNAAAAQALAKLASEWVPGAPVREWWNVADLSSTVPRLTDGADIVVSPSSVEGMLDCPHRWFLKQIGCDSFGEGAARLGTLIHAVAAQVPHGGRAELLAELDRQWEASEDWPDTWWAAHDKMRAEQMIGKWAAFLAMRAKSGIHNESCETRVYAEYGPVTIAGRVDRLDRLPDGGLEVVDIKTGSSAVSAKDAQQHIQLGVYQAALDSGGVSGVPGASGGAQLVYIGTSTKTASARAQSKIADAEDPDWVAKLLAESAEIARGSVFATRPGSSCSNCPVVDSCPAHNEQADIHKAEFAEKSSR